MIDTHVGLLLVVALREAPASCFLSDGASSGAIKPIVGATLPLSQTANAHAMLERRQVQGVIVLDPNS